MSLQGPAEDDVIVSAATTAELRNTPEMVHTRCYRNGVLTDEGFSLKDVSEHLEDGSAMVWVDLCAPDLSDLQLLADELGLHTLAVEDATSGRQRPKFTRYTGHDFLTAYAVQLDVETGQLVTGEIAAFITAHALVTVRKDNDFPIEGLLGRWDKQHRPDQVRRRVARARSARLRRRRALRRRPVPRRPDRGA